MHCLWVTFVNDFLNLFFYKNWRMCASVFEKNWNWLSKSIIRKI